MTSSPICNYMKPSPWETRADIPSEHKLGKRRNQAFLRLWVSVKRGGCLWLWSLEFLVQVLCGILDPLLFGVSTDLFAQLGLEDYGFQSASAVGDSFVALQECVGNLLTGHDEAAGSWDGAWVSQPLGGEGSDREQQE